MHQHVTGAERVDGVVAPAVAVIRTGCVNGPMAALVAADAALHTGLITHADLSEAGVRVQGARSFAVRRLLATADGRAESPGETRLRHAVQLMGFGATPQVVLADGAFVALVDLLLDEVPVVLQFDGFVTYSRAAPHDVRLSPADVVAAEKLREDRMRELGYEVLRVTWAELADLPALRRRIEAAVAWATYRRVGAELRARP